MLKDLECFSQLPVLVTYVPTASVGGSERIRGVIVWPFVV